MKKQKQTPEEKKQEKQANVALDRLIVKAKQKGAFISEEIIKKEQVQQTLFND